MTGIDSLRVCCTSTTSAAFKAPLAAFRPASITPVTTSQSRIADARPQLHCRRSGPCCNRCLRLHPQSRDTDAARPGPNDHDRGQQLFVAASLDTVSFAPLLQADANSGVIITDWYANPKAPGERVKLTVSILSQDLRADALRVAASRQVLQNGVWVEAPVRPQPFRSSRTSS
jgi:hypothetical protein